MAENKETVYSGLVVAGVDNAAYYGQKLLATLKSSRQCSIVIANNTPYTLCNPQRFEDNGRVINMPMRIPPFHTGLIGAQKRIVGLKGTSGVITYEIENMALLNRLSPCYLQVVWSVPYIGDNRVSVMVGEDKASKELFTKLHDEDDENLHSAPATSFTKLAAENKLRIDGFMSTESEAILITQIQEA